MVGLIFVLAWLMRRVQNIGPGNAQVIEMIGSRALGPRDRLVLVQVGEEQILLGLTPAASPRCMCSRPRSTSPRPKPPRQNSPSA